MAPRWNRAIAHLSRLGLQSCMESRISVYSGNRNYSKVAAAAASVSPLDSTVKGFSGKTEHNVHNDEVHLYEYGLPSNDRKLVHFTWTPLSLLILTYQNNLTADPRKKLHPIYLYCPSNMINLNKMFWSKPCSLALASDSPLRIEEPKYEGFRRIMLKLLLFYSKQSKSIRGANVIYRRVISQVDKPAIYNVFSLEQTFKITFSLLVLHMWLCLRRLKQEGEEGVELGQYVYEIYNHDVELRVSKAGVNLLLTRWMKDLEKIFYGNIVAYDAAMLPEAKQDELQNVIWRNIFSDDGSPMPNDAAAHTVQAMSRYVRREYACMSLTDKEAMLSGNFMFTSLEKPLPDRAK